MVNANKNAVPMWHKYALTIEEAAIYYHIGEAKIRTLCDDNPNADFYFLNGNRVLIKRAKFEEYLDRTTVV